MARQLTRKQQELVTACVETGVGVKAALKAYDTDYNNARATASESLTEPSIREAINKALPARNIGPERWEEALMML